MEAGNGARRRRLIERIAELSAAELALLGLVALVAAAGGFLLCRTDLIPEGHSPAPTAFSDVAEPQAGALAARFRPWLLFDRGELWRPLDVSSFLAEGDHRFCTRAAGAVSCRPLPDATAFDDLARPGASAGAATYLDVAGSRLADYRGPQRCGSLDDCGTGARSAIYYHATESNDRFYLDYWWFLRFNHFARSHPAISCRVGATRTNGVCDEHEGDWEGVTVVTPPDDDQHVDYVVYAAHKGTFRYAASTLQLRDGTRPVVYVAQGSHASYPAPCRSGCHQPPGLAVDGVLELPEGDTDGTRPWARDGDDCVANRPGSCLESLALQPWNQWPGQWGAGCGDACGGNPGASSPRSPGLQPRYQAPWCSTQGGAFTCDSRALRCGDWLGPQVVLVACDPGVLSQSQRRSDALAPGRLALVVGRTERSQETTPGVVQALGPPLRPGEQATVVADGPATQILVRSVQDGTIAEDRFVVPAARAGQRIAITVTAGADAPLVLADGQRPVERRLVTAATAPAPAG
ncbi:MAG: hypothetical protein JSS99_13265 [Actinobacteria bacterium]|nr:hypothetical protein [Actinomycetota bacterium]